MCKYTIDHAVASVCFEGKIHNVFSLAGRLVFEMNVFFDLGKIPCISLFSKVFEKICKRKQKIYHEIDT